MPNELLENVSYLLSYQQRAFSKKSILPLLSMVTFITFWASFVERSGHSAACSRRLLLNCLQNSHYSILHMINPSSLLSLFWVTLLEPFKFYHCLYFSSFLSRFICISTVTINYICLHVAKATFALLISLFFLLLSSQGFPGNCRDKYSNRL